MTNYLVSFNMFDENGVLVPKTYELEADSFYVYNKNAAFYMNDDNPGMEDLRDRGVFTTDGGRDGSQRTIASFNEVNFVLERPAEVGQANG